MENTNIAAANANVNALGRPVMIKDIAEKLGLSESTVRNYLNVNNPQKSETIQRVRETAAQMGYIPRKAMAYTGKMSAGKLKPHSALTQQKIADALGTNLSNVNRALNGKLFNKELAKKIVEYAAQNGYESKEERAKKAADEATKKAANKWYHGTAFRTKEELISYMQNLRDLGYGNMEIAKKSGVTPITVRRNIGIESAYLAKHNRVLGQKIRAQKNAARAAYLRNKPIAEYNAKVKEHNDLKAKVVKLEAELSQQQPAIEKLAAQKIPVPQIDLGSLQPTALQ